MQNLSLLTESLLAAWMDLRRRRISNGFLAGCLFWNLGVCLEKCGYRFPVEALWGSLMPLLLVPFWMRGGLGAGDLKLFMVLGLLLGRHSLWYLWGTFVSAAGMHLLGRGLAKVLGTEWDEERIPIAAAGGISLLFYLGGWYG